MPTLTPLLVKIELKPAGGAKYPNFNTLASVLTSGSDWAVYVDQKGSGWLYDHDSGHADDDPARGGSFNSPVGQQWGVLLVPLAFANEAVAAFPVECSILSEADTEEFYDSYGAAREQDNIEDGEVLRNIAAKEQIFGSLKPSDVAALDPDNPARGILRNHRKTWQRLKTHLNITVG